MYIFFVSVKTTRQWYDILVQCVQIPRFQEETPHREGNLQWRDHLVWFMSWYHDTCLRIYVWRDYGLWSYDPECLPYLTLEKLLVIVDVDIVFAFLLSLSSSLLLLFAVSFLLSLPLFACHRRRWSRSPGYRSRQLCRKATKDWCTTSSSSSAPTTFRQIMSATPRRVTPPTCRLIFCGARAWRQ